MNREEIALANKGGRSFADLCDDVRETTKAHIRAIEARERAEQYVKVLKQAEDDADDAADEARLALNRFIERECEVEV